jgi:hypothetical protein
LLDAIGQTITTDLEKIAALEEGKRPGVVIVSIVSDGLENRSVEYTREQVKKLVEEREDANWVVSYVGAGIDASAAVQGLGVPCGNVASAGGGKAGVYAGYGAISNMTSRSREATSAGTLRAAKNSRGLGFTEDELKDMGSKS